MSHGWVVAGLVVAAALTLLMVSPQLVTYGQGGPATLMAPFLCRPFFRPVL